MTKGPKGQRYSKNCLRIRGQPTHFIKGQVLVSFAPLPKKKNIKHTSILPTFNRDEKHYTVAFHLPSTEQQREEILQEDHEKRVRESQLQISQMYYPKPRSRHRYCGVCRGYYEDYKEHVESAEHGNRLSTSEFQKLIKRMALQVQEHVSKKQEEERAVESLSEQQIYKNLSTQTLEALTAKVEPVE